MYLATGMAVLGFVAFCLLRWFEGTKSLINLRQYGERVATSTCPLPPEIEPGFINWMKVLRCLCLPSVMKLTLPIINAILMCGVCTCRLLTWLFVPFASDVLAVHL